jgi:mRNA interferase MazF
MPKDFDSWNQLKKKLQQKNKRIFFHEREIWWCSLGLNLGDEEDGKNYYFERPVLVLRRFNSRIALVLPLSSQIKYNRYYHIHSYEKLLVSVLLSQIKVVSTKRFSRFVRKISASEFELIRKKVRRII